MPLETQTHASEFPGQPTSLRCSARRRAAIEAQAARPVASAEVVDRALDRTDRVARARETFADAKWAAAGILEMLVNGDADMHDAEEAVQRVRETEAALDAVLAEVR